MRPRRWFLLDEIFAGSCDGMTYEEIEEQHPEEFELRKADKLAYRSCLDIPQCLYSAVPLSASGG